MATTEQANKLRARADDLRRFARTLENARFTTAHTVAGDDTWVGPTAQACANDLRRLARQLLLRCDELRVAARRLDRAADAITSEIMAERAMTAAAPAGVR